MNLGVSTLKKTVTAATAISRTLQFTKFANTATWYKVVPTGFLLIKNI